MDGHTRLVVVGASLAGLRAAESARRTGFDGTITLIGAEPRLPYDRPPLSKKALEPGNGEGLDTTFRTHELLRDDLRLDLRLGTPATALDTEHKIVGTGDTEIPYDSLVIATGATARPLAHSEHLTGVHRLRTADDARAVRTALDAGARTVIVGAGFIGSEVASAARKHDLPVTVVEALPVPLGKAIGPAMGHVCAALHARNGTDLRCGVSVERVEGDGRVERVRLSDGSVLDADLVVVGTGADPATSWLDGSGLTLNAGLDCDETLATSAPDVYAAGDVARWRNPLFGESMRLEHWTSAAEQGMLAARNALRPGEAAHYSSVPYFWSDWYDTRIQFVGISDAEETRVVTGEPDSGQLVALYRRGDRLVGALALNYPSHIMKYRAMIGKGARWTDALEFARKRSSSVRSAAR